MANTFTSLNPEYWSNEMQETLFVENTAVFLAGTEAAAVLAQNGRKYHKPIVSKPKVGTYTPGTDIDDRDITSSDETLEVDTFKYASEYIDDTQKKQSLYDAASFASKSMQKQLNNVIEQAFLNKVTDANHDVDAGSVGGTAGSTIQVTTSNIMDIFTAANTKLDVVDAPMTNRVAVVGAHTLGVMRRYKGQRETPLGDTVLANGFVGPWQGWLVVYNNNLPYSAVLSLVTAPTDGDTITIAGVTFTFKTTLGSTAGNVLIGANVDAARANLAKAINDSGTVDTHYVQLSAEDRFILTEKRGITATNDDSADTLTLAGFGDIVVSESLTDATDTWTSATQHSWFGIRGATDLAVQMPAGVEVTRVEKRFGDRIKALAGYGVKTFADGKRLLVDVNIDALNWR
jgi:hypothetical protein